MASTTTRRRPRAAARMDLGKTNGERYLTDARGKRIAIVLTLDEYSQLVHASRSTRPCPAEWDWLAAARALRARAASAPDSTPILRALREERARR